MAMTDLAIVRRSLTSRPFSTVTTVLMVAIAVALMLVLLSMRHAAERAFSSGPGNMHLLVSRDNSPLTSVLNNIFHAGAPPRPILMSEHERIADSFPLDYAIPLQMGDSYRGLPVVATTEEFFTRFEPAIGRPWKVAQGRIFEREYEVVVGADAARRTGLRPGSQIFLTHGTGRAAALAESSGQTERAVGGTLAAHVHKEFVFTVVGILEPSGGPHDRALFVNLDSSWVLHAHDRRLEQNPGAPLTTAADITDADRLITGMYLRVLTRPGSEISSAIAPVFARLRADPTLVVAQPGSEIQKLFVIVGNIDRIFLAMAVVVMVSSAISIMVALYNSMEQRRRQVAVLRVLGCSRARLFGLIVTESAMIGLLGAAAGIVLAFIGGRLASEAIERRLELVIQPALGPETVLVVVVATVVLASLAGIAPAMVAYRTAVAKNLRPLG